MSWDSEKNAPANATAIAARSTDMRDGPRRARTAARTRRRGIVTEIAAAPTSTLGRRGRTTVRWRAPW